MSLSMSLSSYISKSSTQSKQDGDLPNNSFKINALYYKKHTRTAVGIRGKLILDQNTLSFQSKSKKGNKELNYTWNLSSICVERYKGRMHEGIKICGQRQCTIYDDEQQPTEYIFTMVNQRSYDILDEATSMARFDASMNKVRRSSMQQFEKNGVSLSSSLSNSLSVVDDEVVDTAIVKQRPPLLLRPLRFLFMIIVRLFSLFYMSCTGRRFWSPQNMHDALHGILTRVSPILSVSKSTLSDIRVRSIEKDINRIHQRLRSIQLMYHKQSPAFQSSGNVAEGKQSSFYKRRFISLASILSWISYVIFCLRKALNIPQYRWQLMEPYQSPSTVSQAVKNANEKVLDLIDLVKHQELASEASSEIIEEAEAIQLLLFNIKLNSTGEIIMPDSSSKEE